VSGQYGVILPANFLKEKEEMELKVYNNTSSENLSLKKNNKYLKMSREPVTHKAIQ
jgi:hypothetical protein